MCKTFRWLLFHATCQGFFPAGKHSTGGNYVGWPTVPVLTRGCRLSISHEIFSQNEYKASRGIECEIFLIIWHVFIFSSYFYNVITWLNSRPACASDLTWSLELIWINRFGGYYCQQPIHLLHFHWINYWYLKFSSTYLRNMFFVHVLQWETNGL